YTTVHRAWARALIVAALEDRTANEGVSSVLERAFDVSRPRRAAILISWLRHDAAGLEFVRAWVTQRDGRLAALVASGAKVLVDLGLLAAELHLLLHHSSWTPTLGAAFTQSEAAITSIITAAGPNDWYWLRQIFGAMDYACPETSARVLGAWDPRLAAATLRSARADAWDDADWFVGGVSKHSEAWCRAVGAELTFEQFLPALEAVRGPRVISRLRQLMSRLQVPFRRSHLKALWAAFARAFATADLDALSPMSGTDWDLEIYPDDVRAAVAKLDPVRLGEQLTAAKPAYWGRLLHVTLLAARAGSEFPAKLSERLGERLVKRIQEYGPAHPYELRLMLWQLGFLPDARKEQMAGEIYDAVLAAARYKGEQEQLLRAFGGLCASAMAKLAKELNVAPAAPHAFDALRTPILDAIPGLREALRQLEESARDYEIQEVLTATRTASPVAK
ncbi:MAG: hypothetical protein ACHREM_11840, partial [Polyangiales bacterium]